MAPVVFFSIIAAVLGMSLSSAVFSSGLPVVGHPAEAGSAVSVSVVDMIVAVIPKDLITPILKRDMLQVNVIGDIAVTTALASREKLIDTKIYAS